MQPVHLIRHHFRLLLLPTTLQHGQPDMTLLYMVDGAPGFEIDVNTGLLTGTATDEGRYVRTWWWKNGEMGLAG